MFYSKEFLAISFIWVANLIFLTSLVPQIFLNKKFKSTNGLSDFFILGNFNSVVCNLGYTFFVGLPFVYKIMNPLYTFLILIVFLQRFYYSNKLNNKKFLSFFLINIFIILFIFWNIFYKCNLTGYFLGWIPIFISLCKKGPQIFKIYNTKSVRGFSLGFIVISLFGHSFEIGGTFALGLPNAVLVQNLKGLLVYSIFLYQFIFYSNFNEKNSIYEVK